MLGFSEGKTTSLYAAAQRQGFGENCVHVSGVFGFVFPSLVYSRHLVCVCVCAPVSVRQVIIIVSGRFKGVFVLVLVEGALLVCVAAVLILCWSRLSSAFWNAARFIRAVTKK